jgi:hypothetical protein
MVNAETGTTIIGTQESPTVLNVVPWQTIELRPSEWEGTSAQTRSVLDDSLQPIDRDVLQRETDYFTLLRQMAESAQTEPQAAQQPDVETTNAQVAPID